DGVARNRGHIDVSQSFFFVPNMSLRFQYAKLRTDGRVIRFTGQLGHNVVGCGAAESIQDVHDLPFTATQCGMWCARHIVLVGDRCLIGLIDDEDIDGALCMFELEPELVFESCEDIWEVQRLGLHSTWRRDWKAQWIE